MRKIKDFKLKGANLEFTYCHRKPERSFFWKGKQFPLCARCTGINLGYVVLPLFIFGVIKIPLLWTVLLIIPTYIDGAIQAYFNIESTNSRRFITGLMSGIGTMSLISIIGIYIGNLILTIIN
ncbi:putative membrane protein [Mesonia hippocampi]|uniref:Putative membrane protein n=1 Tax=Mesonia hippocampi TaxID=1628250 RepID=A0A840EV20_9FLAO|nr:DUF2085 domain-containing protein [Mesonia hippocampi]MBB4117934.1 putative membrane protein [Mesonia hippocampi]